MKTALITGGSTGIGFAIAKRFVKEGYHTIICGRSSDKLTAAINELGFNCQGIQIDLGDLDKIPPFVQSIVDQRGTIDVLINNAGINQKKDLIEVSDHEYHKIIEVNQSAVFTLSREVIKNMIADNVQGSIVHISSMASNYGIPKVISYTASKSAIEGMTRAMAVELSPIGIRVNCVAPGFIKTAMSSKALDNDPERKAKVIGRTPLQRLGRTDEVANVVYFLASDEASFITGEIIKVDGGNSIGF